MHWGGAMVFKPVSMVQVTFTTVLTYICGQCVLPNSSQPTGWIDMKCDIPWRLALQIKASSKCSKFGNFLHTIRVSCITQNTANLWHTIKASSKIKSRHVILWDTLKANSKHVILWDTLKANSKHRDSDLPTGWLDDRSSFLLADLYMGWLAEELICWRVDFLTVWSVDRLTSWQVNWLMGQLLWRVDFLTS